MSLEKQCQQNSAFSNLYSKKLTLYEHRQCMKEKSKLVDCTKNLRTLITKKLVDLVNKNNKFK